MPNLFQKAKEKLREKKFRKEVMQKKAKPFLGSIQQEAMNEEFRKAKERKIIADRYSGASKSKNERISFQREREAKANQKIIDYENRQKKYDKSSAGRVSNKVERGFAFIKNPALEMYKARGDIRPRLARDPYSKAGERNRRGYAGAQVVRANRQTSAGVQSGAVGRPYGTFQYRHPVTGQPIGVYEYRKILSAQLRNERIQVQGQSGYSPQQLNTLQRIQAQQRYNQSNVEGQAIPDTYGQVNTRSIHNEADAASHLFD